MPTPRACALIAVLCLPTNGGCVVENLDVAATLAATPTAALASPVAVGARFDLSIDDACSVGGVLGCSPERVSDITAVEVDDAILDVVVDGESTNKLNAEALAQGDTELSVTATFEGNEDSGERTAELTVRVRDVVAVDVEPWCDRDASVVAVPPGVGITTTLAYLGDSRASGGGDRVSLWHDEVNWPAEIAFDGETPSGVATALETSPVTADLTFTTLGWSTAVDARSGDALVDFLVYGPADLTDMELDAPASLNVEEQGNIDVDAFIDDLSLCVGSPEVVVEAFVLDPGACGLGGLGVDSWEGTLRESIPVTGAASGLCEVEVALPDAGLSVVAAIDVIDLIDDRGDLDDGS